MPTEFYQYRAITPNNGIEFHTFDRLRINIARLVDRIPATTNTSALLLTARVATTLWVELVELPTEPPTQPRSPRQDLVVSHWTVFLLCFVYQEVQRIGKYLPTNCRVELTPGNLFEYGRVITDDPKQFFIKYQDDAKSQLTDSTNLTLWFRDLKQYTRNRVHWKMRDKITQIEGCKTYGSKSLGLVSDASPAQVKEALINYGLSCVEGDGRLLKILHQVFQEVKNSQDSELETPATIVGWSDIHFQLVAQRWQQFTATFPPFQDRDLRNATTKQQLEFLGKCLRIYLDPSTDSLNKTLPNLDGDLHLEIIDFIPAPWEQDSAESSSINKLINEYLKKINEFDTAILLFKYTLLDPSRNISLSDKVSSTRKIYATQEEVAIEMGVNQTTIRYHLNQIFEEIRDRLFQILEEPKNIDTLRTVLKEVLTYYTDLLESYLVKTIDGLPAPDRHFLRQVYLDRQQEIDPDKHSRIHALLNVGTRQQILNLLNLPQLNPDGQAILVISQWIETQLNHRPQQYL